MALRDLRTRFTLPRQVRRSPSVTILSAQREPIDITPGREGPAPTYQGRDLRLAGLTAAAMAAVVSGGLAYAILRPEPPPAPPTPHPAAPAVHEPPAVVRSPGVPSAVRQSRAG